MSNNALYLYGIVKSYDKNWKSQGIKGNNVFLINNEEFSAVVHSCDEKPYISNDPAEIKDLIIAHNEVLDKAMNDFGGVMPLSFNTIIKTSTFKKDKKTAWENLKNWLKNNERDLQKIWDKIKGKKECGIRIYYEKEKVLEKIKEIHKIKQLQREIQTETTGIAYLLKGKIETEINELTQKQILEYKQKLYNDIKEKVSDITINDSKILLDEKKELLLSLSLLVNEEQIEEIKGYLVNSNFYFKIAGPFAPYSFVNPQKSIIPEVSRIQKTRGFCRNE